MPYKDEKKRLEAIKESKKSIYAAQINLSIRRDSGLNEPLTIAAKEAGLSKAQYMIQATRKQLIADGYMTESPDTPDAEE